MQDNNGCILENIPYLRRYARALLSNVKSADMLVQQSINCAIDLSHVLQPNADIKCWLFSVFHNLYIESIKNNLAKSNLYEYSESDASNENNSECDWHYILNKLSIDQKEIFLLVSLENFSYDEVCQIVSLPLGALLSHLHSARTIISQHLFNEGNSPQKIEIGCA